jgi:proteic killer suppression protein
MIRSFADAETEALFRDGVVPARWRTFEKVAYRKLDMLDAAVRVEDLRVPPGNRLEKLRGDLSGSWSIRINDQWRIIFRFDGEGPQDVAIVDYHRG